jgi:predicted secreted hydrolase
MTASALSRCTTLALVAALVGACTGGPLLANPPRSQPSSRPEPTPAARPPDPQPVRLPLDDGPHDRLTEWWYYTGHFRDGFGERYGFEFVIFRAERGGFPVSWASHVALTDETRGRFHYAQRSEIGPQVDESAPAAGFQLRMSGLDPLDPLDPADPASAAPVPWAMAGQDGSDRLRLDVSDEELEGDPLPQGFALSLDLTAAKPAALHDQDGYVDFGPAGGSYYYSRTSMAATGLIRLGNSVRPAIGTAWFDHQWGDFISVGGGGWDWFAVNLDDGVELTLSQVRAADGSYPLVYGTMVDADGATRHLGPADFTVEVTDTWMSPTTSAVYPAGWTITIPGDGLTIELRPTVAQQELDTRATTGVTYWEGSQVVTARRGGEELRGRAYVELTGYGPG